MNQSDERFARTLHHASKSTEIGHAFSPPIVNTSVYRLAPDPSGPYQYARWANPTWTALEEALAILEDAETVTFPSGMAAIAAVLYSSVKSGDRILLPSDGYYTVRVFAEKYLLPMGIGVDHCPTAEVAARALDGYRLAWIETPSNPGLDLADIAAVVRNAKACGALVAVDNTTMTPLGQRPLDLGADVVVSADTKALNGHSDVLFGHVSSRNAQLIDGVREWRKVAGAVPGPHEAWLVHRGLETLEVRFSRMRFNALVLAELLERHPKVVVLRYPGLAVASGASSGTSADDRWRKPDRAYACGHGSRRAFHPRLPVNARIDQFRRRSHMRRAPRALGRRGAGWLHSRFSRLRADRSAGK